MYYDKDGDLKPGKKGNIFAKITNFIAGNHFIIKQKYKKIVNKVSQYLYGFYRNLLKYATVAKIHGSCGRGGRSGKIEVLV